MHLYWQPCYECKHLHTIECSLPLIHSYLHLTKPSNPLCRGPLSMSSIHLQQVSTCHGQYDRHTGWRWGSCWWLFDWVVLLALILTSCSVSVWLRDECAATYTQPQHTHEPTHAHTHTDDRFSHSNAISVHNRTVDSIAQCESIAL